MRELFHLSSISRQSEQLVAPILTRSVSEGLVVRQIAIDSPREIDRSLMLIVAMQRIAPIPNAQRHAAGWYGEAPADHVESHSQGFSSKIDSATHYRIA
jgi:hypothetical protein